MFFVLVIGLIQLSFAEENVRSKFRPLQLEGREVYTPLPTNKPISPEDDPICRHLPPLCYRRRPN